MPDNDDDDNDDDDEPRATARCSEEEKAFRYCIGDGCQVSLNAGKERQRAYPNGFCKDCAPAAEHSDNDAMQWMRDDINESFTPVEKSYTTHWEPLYCTSDGTIRRVALIGWSSETYDPFQEPDFEY